MTTYLDFEELLKVHDKKIDEWEYALREAAVSLRDVMVDYLNPPTEEFEEIMSMGTAEGRKMRKRKRVGLEIQDMSYEDGSLLFAVSINFENHKPFVFHLSVRFTDSKLVYRTGQNEPSLPKEEMAKMVIERLANALRFDPFSGKDKPAMGFLRE